MEDAGAGKCEGVMEINNSWNNCRTVCHGKLCKNVLIDDIKKRI